MPVFLATLLTGLFNLCKSKLGYFVATAFVWLGINWGSYHFVISPLVEQLYTYIDSVGSAGGRFGELALRALGLLNFDRALTMIISAYVSRFAVLNGRLYLFKRGYGAAPPSSPKVEPVIPPAG
ncbi:DUF2523 family protein [Xylella fastidiosa]|uniref:DUF2523 domain-containing protein n=1 Tax=Xylella fastidiosa subsp. multiplex TaxID=644357 RepID=A0AAW6HWW6_XYLFS|nr:DUF2523 family protein [Xylella fastidiosa]MDC6408498.1 DUF2523 domain-containing protein [Xylella fastidiosa subsp. multiplex]MDC7969573.1 DUF2523 family protein [Xylella fastidiosa subsp. multiplex]MDC7970757.1 DUF2523 family protein [Xylella fastidiosa subsp. multiplex]MDD0936800.1 DUF2523 domain-containing protein [Xylella fastidiosa subsp. multiplex]MDD0943673.1 DUF2523 domain-containing protein [Xylella fastidiosa subsp. multiplex]